jgi:hypothetical protein
VALIALASAKGSPGVTTAGLLFGALWPRHCVLAECDAAGGDVAWRMPSPQGRPLDPQAGLVSLSAAGRRGMHPALVGQHAQPVVGGLEVLTGVSMPEQAGGLAWTEIGGLFAQLPGTDVIADLGRIGANTPQNELLAAAHLIVMVVDTVPSNVIHLRERIARFHPGLGGALAPPVHVVVVAAPKRTRAVREAREALDHASTPYEEVHHLAHDEAGANFFLGQVRGKADRTALVRSAGPIVERLAARSAGAFVPEPPPPPPGPPTAPPPGAGR